MALTRYHRGKNSISKRIGTKKLSKKLGIEINSLGWNMFGVNHNNRYDVINSSKDCLEQDVLNLLDEWRD